MWKDSGRLDGGEGGEHRELCVETKACTNRPPPCLAGDDIRIQRQTKLQIKTRRRQIQSHMQGGQRDNERESWRARQTEECQ